MHYHYLTIEQRESLEKLIGSSVAENPSSRPRWQNSRLPIAAQR